MMDDFKIMEALSEMARRAGLIGAGESLCAVETEAVVALADMCMKPSPAGKHRIIVACIEPRRHEGMCSWERAFIGAVTPRTVVLDRRPVFGAVDRSKVDLTTESPEIRCQVWSLDGRQCAKVRGHEDLHLRADGTAMIWRTDEITTESPEIRCPVTKDDVQCVKVRGHLGLHYGPDRKVMMWRTDEPGKRPEFDPPPNIPLCHAIDGCIHEAGHRGDHETKRPERCTFCDSAMTADGWCTGATCHQAKNAPPRIGGNDVTSPDPKQPRT